MSTYVQLILHVEKEWEDKFVFLFLIRSITQKKYQVCTSKRERENIIQKFVKNA